MDHGLNDVRHWLSSLHLNEYTKVFTDHGFTSLRKCSILNESHLRTLHIPSEYHSTLLAGARNLQLSFPNNVPNNAPPPPPEGDVPPPLPEKKSRRSLPSPAPRAKHAQNRNNNATASPKPTRQPPAIPITVPPMQMAPPSAPPRKSVLRKSMVIQDGPTLNKDTAAESRIPPPDPLNDDLIDLSGHIQAMSPGLPSKKNRKSSSRTDDSNPTVNIVVDKTNDMIESFDHLEVAGDDHYVTQPPPDHSPTQKKVRPAVKPRPTITPRPNSMHRSPTPLRASLSNTLPLPKADGIYHDSGPKSATLPTKVYIIFHCLNFC